MTTGVLHIRSDVLPEDVDDAVSAALAAQDVSIETCGDVYRGLARLMRSDGSMARAVVVCLDGLTAGEFEFFTIAARLRPTVPVYVYAGPRSSARVERAISLGASSEVTQELLTRLTEISATPVRAERITPPPAESPGAPERVAQDVAEPEEIKTESPNEASFEDPASAAAPPDLRDEETVSEDAVGSEAPVRVPWLRHEHRPVRRGPTGRSDAPPRPVTAESAAKRSSPTEPLLTDEELQALMGDDIASIAPKLRLSPSADDRDDEGD